MRPPGSIPAPHVAEPLELELPIEAADLETRPMHHASENAFLQVLKIHESFGKIILSFSHFIKPVAEVAERP